MKIACDFDGTIVRHEFPAIGDPVPHALESIRQLEADGHQIILYTMRSGKYLQDAQTYLWSNQIRLWGINEDPGQKGWTDSPKAYANLYIDDAGLGCPLIWPVNGERPYVDWRMVMRKIHELETTKRVRQKAAQEAEARYDMEREDK